MILYHGSTMVIRAIDLSLSQPNKDFGRGFYLSETEDQARALALFKSSLLGLSPVVNAFDIDEAVLTDGTLKVKRFEGYTRDWAEFVLANRTAEDGEIHHGGYDVVYGPIANDRVGLQIRRLLEKETDFDTFLKRLQYIKGITFQYYFGSQKAIAYLHYHE